MNRKILTVFFLAALFVNSFSQRILFDSGWRFYKGKASGSELPGFDDSEWREIDLPHDWSIEDLPGKHSPFSPDAISATASGYTVGGTAWYRKTFTISEDNRDKIILIYFEGVYMNSDIWINGYHIGNHPYGYTGFWLDLTDKIRFGEKNVVAVEVKNEGRNSRWYSGSGIYRHVWLNIEEPFYIEPWGIYVTTPELNEKSAVVKVQTDIRNRTISQIKIKIVTKILDPSGREVAKNVLLQQIGSSSIKEFVQNFTIDSPVLWSPEIPALYKAETIVYSDEIPADNTETIFGIRSISFDVTGGLLINGKTTKLRGGCMHHDNGILGSAAFDRAEERKVELLKRNGFNAVRCSHNPPSEKFLEACDRLGLIVIDEAFDQWQKPKNPDDYNLYFDKWWESDLSSMILRDRNHPSVIFWSLGNEIEERADPAGTEITKKFRKVIEKYDGTRPVTLAVCEFWDHPGRNWDETAPAFDQVNIGGYNYQWYRYESDHEKFPARIMMGTESVPIQASQNWQMVEKHSYVIGDFVWTAMDYLGETGIGHTSCEGTNDQQLMPFPWVNAYCGDIDLIGNKKPQSYFRDVVWRNSFIEMAVHVPMQEGCNEKVSFWGWPDEQQSWTWPGYEGRNMKVNIYSHSSSVRLELNGKVIGVKQISDTSNLTASFEVPYEPGVLSAVALDKGNEAGEVAFATAGRPAGLRLIPDRLEISNDRNDLCYISVEVVDKNGSVVPDAAIPIDFTIKGSGSIISAGNANPADTSSLKDKVSNSFRGKCLAIIQPGDNPGEIIFEAKAPGIKTEKIRIKVIK